MENQGKVLFNTSEKEFCLYNGDSFDVLSTLDCKVDMIFADPPYFLSSGDNCIFNGTKMKFDKGYWDRKNSYIEKNNFNYKWIQLCANIIKPSGTIWICGFGCRMSRETKF